jgi:hypothetical protein
MSRCRLVRMCANIQNGMACLNAPNYCVDNMRAAVNNPLLDIFRPDRTGSGQMARHPIRCDPVCEWGMVGNRIANAKAHTWPLYVQYLLFTMERRIRSRVLRLMARTTRADTPLPLFGCGDQSIKRGKVILNESNIFLAMSMARPSFASVWRMYAATDNTSLSVVGGRMFFVAMYRSVSHSPTS